MSFSPSQRIKRIRPPPIDVLNRLANQFPDVISLGQGLPHFSPPEFIYQALIKHQQSVETHIYSSDMGLEELRLLLSDRLKQSKQGDFQLDEIMITAGANQAFANICLTVLDVRDEVIIPSPYYFNHVMAIEAVDAIPIEWPMLFENGIFYLDIENLPDLITSHTKAIILISPNNPTGCVYNPEAIAEVVKIAYEHNMVVISDDTYIDFNFSDKIYNFSKSMPTDEHIIHMGSFSKNLGMSGWRCGYIASKIFMEELLKIQDTLVICAPIISQLAVVEALKWEGYSKFVEEKRKEIQHKGTYLAEKLKEVPFLEETQVQGSFYVFPKIKMKKEISSENLAIDLLRKCRVLTVPGSAFGKAGEGFLRLSYGFSDMSMLETAIKRLSSFSNV